MANSEIVIGIAVLTVILIVVVLWYLRFRQNKGITERVRRSPQTYIGQLARGVYQIELPHNRVYVGYATPPPTFSKAVNFPLPPPRKGDEEVVWREEAPPTYIQAQQQYLILDVHNLNRGKARTPLQCV